MAARKNSGKMKKTLLLLFFYSAVNCLPAQNLIPNPSFEETQNCGAWMNDDVFNDWQAFGGFFFGVPFYTYGIDCGVNLEGTYECPAQDGDAYISLNLASIENGVEAEEKTYTYVELLDTLSPNTCYTFSCYWRRAEHLGALAGNKFGAWLSHEPPELESQFSYPLIDTIPQVISPDSVFFFEAANWEYFEQSFEASGGEQYITIGAFQSMAEMQFYYEFYEGANYKWIMYFDQLELKECPPISTLEMDKPSELFLYPNPASKSFNIQPNGLESIVIYNYRGELLLTEHDVSKSIDCSLWPPGIYLVEGRYANHEIVRQRMMVNH